MAIEVRKAVPGDLPAIAAVALANGQGEEWAGADPAYDLFMATEPGLLDPRRAVPSPALA